jgi:hypothetical protein
MWLPLPARRRLSMKRLFVTITCVAMMPGYAAPDSGSPSQPERYCAALTNAVSVQLSGAGRGFVRSYDPGANESALPPVLASTAFVYDNALAVIALVGCGDVGSATVIGNALSAAVRSDRSFTGGRIRNAYRAGSLDQMPPTLPGWWDDKQKIWAEDPTLDGTSTGNVAWAALALLTLHEATRQGLFLDDARQLIDWVIANVSSGHGFLGGFHGYDPRQVRLTWISTEHNVDVYAAAVWLSQLTGNQKYADAATEARQFLGRAFAADHFLLGTKPDGSLADGAALALDVQLWPWMAVSDAPPEWRSALNFAATHLAVDDGFDFNGDRDGVWVEGTAQASLAYRIAGDHNRSAQLLNSLQADATPSGFLNATRSGRVSTGLSVDPTKPKADFFYSKRPHLGATAWATLATLGWNPFTGKRID